MTHTKTQEFSKKVLHHMRERLSDYQELYGDLYNLEATPAESTTYRLAKHDKKRFPDIITAGKPNDTPYYTNSSHLPVDCTEDIFEALEIQDELQTLYTSGTVFHAFLGEKLPDWQAAAKLVRVIAQNYKLPYYTLSPTYSVCKRHGYLNGEQFVCPHCGEMAEVYSRITGYYRPVQNWNEGKSQEYKNRVNYNVTASYVMPAKEMTASEEEKDAVPVMGMKELVPLQEKGSLLLFTTGTCPNCLIAKEMLSNMEYEVIDAQERMDLVTEYGIMQAPTLIEIKNGEVHKYVNASGIKGFVEGVGK